MRFDKAIVTILAAVAATACGSATGGESETTTATTAALLIPPPPPPPPVCETPPDPALTVCHVARCVAGEEWVYTPKADGALCEMNGHCDDGACSHEVWSSFKTKIQTYSPPVIGFGLPSDWDPIVGDFDGDGNGDYGRVGATGAWMYYGRGNGTFTQVFHEFVGLNFGYDHSWETITGDFDGDGRTDYARLGDKDAFVFFNNADRSIFQGYDEFKWGDHNQNDLHFGFHSPWTTVTGDFNGDGLADFARAGATGAWVFTGKRERLHGGFVTKFHAYSNLNFGLPSDYKTISGDFTGDGKTDYARLNANGAFFFCGNGGGTFDGCGFLAFNTTLFSGVPATSLPVVVGDFDGDDKDEFGILGDRSALFFVQNRFGSFEQRPQSYGGLSFGLPTSWQTITGDFDGDGRTDYARIGNSGGFFYYGAPAPSSPPFERSAFETYPSALQNFGSPSPWQALVGKFNGDPKADYIRLGDDHSVVFLRR